MSISDIHIVPAHFLFLTLLFYFMQKFSFQAMENARIKIAADRTAPDAEDPDHWDKLPRNIRAAAATGKASSPRHFTQD
jgi:Na+-transporting methylmalonyl-CoA/oxaloacetate decarboxylase gamma subunit